MKGGTDHAFMNINIDATGKVTQLEIENSKGKPAINNHNSSRGIGIDNVRKRLELIYPGLHSLKISEKDHTFKVLLQVQL